jgi:hypothetical protein
VYQLSGNGKNGQAVPLSFAALGSRAFGDGWSAIMTTRAPPETTCQHLARTSELRPVVISGMGIPFLVALLAVDPLSKKKPHRIHNGQTLGRTPS